MKIWKYILSAAALLSMGACNHDADEMVVPVRDITIASHSAVVVNDITSAEEFTLVWSAAKFGVQTEVEYAVSAALEGAEAVALATTTDLYYTTTNGELFSALGVLMGGQYEITFTVTATAVATGETTTDTEKVSFKLDKAGYMYVVGAYQGWNPAGACSRLMQADGGVMRGFVNILSDTEGGNEVKICTQQSWNGTNYGMKDGVLSTEPDAGNIVLTKGLHYLHFDVENLKLIDIPLTKVGLIGAGAAFGDWATDGGEFVYDAENNVWTAVVENVTKDSEYKVRFNDMWDVVDAEGNTYNISLGGEYGNLSMGGGNLKAGYDGKVTFTLNLFDAPYTLTEAGPAPKLLHIIGGYQGWNHANPHSTIKGDNGVLTGYFYVPNADSKEFKFCTDLNWDGINYGMTDGVISTDGGAGNITLEPGLYLLKFDYYANAFTATAITKVGLIGNGELFGNWGTDVEMAYNETTQTWNVTIENVPADNEYKVRFNADWGINLGGDAADLTQDGANLKTVKSGTVTYVLNIFAHPYTIVEQ
ncbi:MAG: SusE domain-containing protein [Alistipes sp.]|nr:SusE domain-containing protein [Alistipes sp.]